MSMKSEPECYEALKCSGDDTGGTAPGLEPGGVELVRRGGAWRRINQRISLTFSGAYKSCILKPKIFCLASYHTSPPFQLHSESRQDADYDKAQEQSQGSPVYCNASRSGCPDT